MYKYLEKYFAEIFCSTTGGLILILITRIICLGGFSG